MSFAKNSFIYSDFCYYSLPIILVHDNYLQNIVCFGLFRQPAHIGLAVNVIILIMRAY